jgi:predicted ATP-grasp superfamily ATP-dependent carboligase
MRVLVTDGGERKSLAAVRALARAGAEVSAAGSSPLDPALNSRYCSRRFVWPSAATQPAQFMQALEGALRGGTFDVLLPLGDHTTAIAVHNAGRLSTRVRLALPDPAAFDQLACKWRTAEIAQEMGIPIPATYRPRTEAELARTAAATRYPCVVKPVRGAGAVGFWVASSPAELLARYPRGDAHFDLAFDHRWPLIQEFVAGRTHEVCALADRGRLVAAVTQRRLRSYPPEAGPGVLNETTQEPDLVAIAVRLIEGMGWHGPLQVEFMRRDEDGAALLIELNPRFWGSLDLSICAGVDLPSLTCRLAMGMTPEDTIIAEAGVVFAWLVPYSLLALREGRIGETGLEALFDRRKHTEIDLADWTPHAAHLARSVGRAAWRKLQGLLS